MFASASPPQSTAMIPINQVYQKELLEFQAFLQKVRLLDLKPLAAQLMRAQPQHFSKSIIRSIADYLEFLYLVDRHPDLRLVPTVEVDQVWHHHILDTRKYAEDCQILFGRFIHHAAHAGIRGEEGRLAQLQAFTLTQALYRHHFGRIIESVPADCELFVEGNQIERSATTALVDEVVSALGQYA
jgi:hypothetical protein